MEIFQRIIYVTELIGVMAFSVSGAAVAIESRLDLFGVIVLGVTASLGGGVIRDVLLGITPPSMFSSFEYVLVASAAAIFVFLIAHYKREYAKRLMSPGHNVVLVFDTIGLGVFAVAGVNTALLNGFGENGFLVVFVGTLTGVGGGMLRDLMARQIPVVLKKRIYALAAMGGAWLYYELSRLSIPSVAAMLSGIMFTIIVRLLAVRFNWNLPKAPLID